MKILLTLLLLTGTAQAVPSGAGQADELFAKNLYQEALTLYAGSAGTGSEAAMKALYRAAECEGLLARYGEAAQRLAAMKLPGDPVWRGRFLLLRAETGRQFLARYGHTLPADEQKGVSDVTKLTAAQWRSRVAADYEALWPLRGALRGRPLSEEGYFVNVKNAELSYTPSLWDFAALRWTEWLLSAFEDSGARPDAAPLVKPSYKAAYSAAAPAALKAAAIFEDAASAPDFAGEYWKIRRVTLPFEYPGKVSLGDAADLRASALNTLKSWGETFKTPQARAWAFYHAAAHSQQKPDYAGTVALCLKASKAAPGSRPAGLCDKMRAEIEMPVLELSGSFAPPPGGKILAVNARNLPAVYFRVYRVTPEELAFMTGRDRERGWGHVKYISEKVLRRVLQGKPEAQWSTDISYPEPYGYKRQEITAPPLKKGLYVAVASGDSGFEDGSSLIRGLPLNITDIFLLGTSGPAGDPEDFLYDPAAPARRKSSELFRLYAVNAVTGRPLAGAGIAAYVHDGGYSDWSRVDMRTGPEGSATLSREVPLTYPGGDHYSLDPLLVHNGAYAYWSSPASAGLSVPAPLTIFVETDRPVYRPGQTVKFKVTVLQRRPRGFSAYAGDAGISVTARDANWQDLYSKKLRVTGLGSVAGEFTVPSGRMLGQYSLTANVSDYGANFSGGAQFGVEEYKRPEFEVKLSVAAKPFRYGEKAEVSGDVKYYFGSPVPGATVKYRVTRARYLPRYCWYWSWFYHYTPPQEVASGELKTGEDGKFSFSFTPKPEDGPYADYPAAYQVEAEARDAGGRTITDSRAYRAGAKAYVFDVTPDAGFFTPAAGPALAARLLDLNEQPQAAQGEYTVYRLEKEPEEPSAGGYWGSFSHNPSLEQAFAKVPDGAVADSGKIRFTKNAPARLTLKPLPPGAYRLRFKAKDPWGGESSGELVLVSAAPEAAANSKLRLPSVALFERDSYRLGETARVLIGASSLKGARYVETLAGDFVLERRMLPEGGLSLFTLKVSNEHRGGFGLRWLGAGGFKVYSGVGEADVPRTDRKISLSLDHDPVLAPGQKAAWRLRARDAAGRPVSGEALVKIFDRSLEYYGKDGTFWGDALYPRRPAGGNGSGSLFTPYPVALPVNAGAVQRMLDLFRGAVAREVLPSMRIAASMVRSRYGSFGQSKGAIFGDSDSMMLSPRMVDSEMAGAGAMAEERMSKSDVAAPRAARNELSGQVKKEQSAPVQVRKDFSETAYYNPQLKVLKGEAAFSFRIPERLTSWKVSSYILTANASRGAAAAETVTKKDLMVRLDIPRFFREGDVSRLTAVVTNDTRGELSGEVTLAVSREERDALRDFGVQDPVRRFSVKAGGTESVYWDITAPAGTGLYKARAVARSGRLADAQENDLPLLPSRERLIASSVAALDGDSNKKFSLPELVSDDASRVIEALHLEVQPQLILTVLNSLPFLVTYPYECTEQLLNRYVPLAITNAFYRKYPQLAASAAKVPKRSTITPEWERDNPVRLMTLMETPWENRSRGVRSAWPVTDMLDSATVEAEKESSLGKLKSYQMGSGAFPWFPGGRENLYMTLYVLEGLAEAARYGVQIPEDMARRALSYVLGEIPRHLKPEEGEIATVLYAAYVVTSFPETWDESRTARTYAKAWADYADTQAAAMTAFGKAYASYVYFRLGEKQKAETYLDRAMDGARSDEIAGVYWAPEKISWRWFNDTVEKHAFILRTLLAVRPKDPKIAGLARWLLFNRKANEWKSTKASAAAIYSLLDVMKTKGALDKGDSFLVKWGATEEKLDLKPFDWVGKPLRWSKYGGEIGKRDLAPVVRKTGPGLAFASFSGIYTTDKPAEESPAGMMNVSRRYFLRARKGDGYELRPLASGDMVEVGDQLEVHLTVTTRSQFEFVHLKDPKAAGFEAETLTSGWRWDGLGRYEEPRDSLTNFFMEWLPHGEYVLKYRLRPTTPGRFRLGAAVMQSMYAPEFAAHSAGMIINVK